MAPPPSHDERSFNVYAAVLAWLWPGLGHIALGHVKRGVLIMIGILFLFFGGLLIGGVDTVDSRNDRLWFLAQSLNGPIAFGTDWVRKATVPPLNRDWRDPDLREAYLARDAETIAGLRRPSLSHVNEIGTLYIALAGLMNLVVILDALYPPVRALPGSRAGAAA